MSGDDDELLSSSCEDLRTCFYNPTVGSLWSWSSSLRAWFRLLEHRCRVKWRVWTIGKATFSSTTVAERVGRKLRNQARAPVVYLGQEVCTLHPRRIGGETTRADVEAQTFLIQRESW